MAKIYRIGQTRMKAKLALTGFKSLDLAAYRRSNDGTHDFIARKIATRALEFNYYDKNSATIVPLKDENIGNYLMQLGIFWAPPDLRLAVSISEKRDYAEIVEQETIFRNKAMIIKCNGIPLESSESNMEWEGFREVNNLWNEPAIKKQLADPFQLIVGLYYNPDGILTLAINKDRLDNRDIIDSLAVFGIYYNKAFLTYKPHNDPDSFIQRILMKIKNHIGSPS